MTQPKYGPRLIAALTYAAQKHHPQTRKSGPEVDYANDVPYVAHLLAVAATVLEAGGDEDAAIAGLLHDLIEDCDVKVEEIERLFGTEVARIVDACSEHWDHKGTKPLWKIRKDAHLVRLDTADSQVLLVTAADKIHNGESIINDSAVVGDAIWSRFNTTRDQIVWYYESVLAKVLAGLGPDHYATKRLTRVAQDLRQLAQL